MGLDARNVEPGKSIPAYRWARTRTWHNDSGGEAAPTELAGKLDELLASRLAARRGSCPPRSGDCVECERYHPCLQSSAHSEGWFMCPACLVIEDFQYGESPLSMPYWLRRFYSVKSELPGHGLTGTLTIYRGVSGPGIAEGMSWTLDRAVAEWFARRFGEGFEPRLYAAKLTRTTCSSTSKAVGRTK